MAKQDLNLGAAPNDGTGDPLRDAMDKVNDNFLEVYNALGGSTPTTIVNSGQLELTGSNKITFLYSDLASLPLASSYHGMFAHVHDTGSAYYAHAGSWLELANKSAMDALTTSSLTDVSSTAPSTGEVLKWDGSEWAPSADNAGSSLGTDAITAGMIAENVVTTREIAANTIAVDDLATNISIDFLADVDTTTVAPTDGQALVWDNANSIWEPGTISSGSSYADSDVDTHLNVSGASSGQILSWNGTDYAWVADQTGGGSSYTDSDVDTHLNVSGASSGQLLSWNGTDFAWVADQTGGGSSYGDSDVQTYLSGGWDFHLLPDTNATYDIGSAEYKVRHLFLSDNSLYIGDNTLRTSGNNLLFDGEDVMDFVNLKNTPTTLAGYGITDGGSGATSISTAGNTGTGSVVLSSETLTATGTTGQINVEAAGSALSFSLDSDLTSLTTINGHTIPGGTGTLALTSDIPAESIPTFAVTAPDSGRYQFNGAGTDSDDNPTLYLYRGFTYKFAVNSPGHPFHIQTSTGAYNASNLYTDNVSNPRTQRGTITLTVQMDAPSTLYYVCQYHSAMAGTINISSFDQIYGYLGGAALGPVGIDTTAYATLGTWKIEGVATTSYEWYVDGVLDGSVTSNQYTPIAAQENDSLSCVVTRSNATQGNGTVTLGPYTIQYTAPSLSLTPLGDQSYIQNSGNKTIDCSTAFDGVINTYAVSGNTDSASVVINSASGLLAVNTATLTDGNITITASNNTGSVSDTFALQVEVPTFQTDSGITAVNTVGWEVTHSSPATSYDAVNDPKFIGVTRSGYNNSGSATSFAEYLVLNQRTRDEAPNQNTETSNQVAISDFIYSTDSVAGVTNNSTIPAPKPMGMWVSHNREFVEGSYSAKLAVAHAHAKNGTPVAAVKFIVSDGVNPNVETLVSTMTTTQYDNGQYAPHYEATLNISGLDDGLLTVDAVIYPHVGTSFQLSVDAQSTTAGEGPNLQPLLIYKDAGSLGGKTYAYVDTAATGSGTASSDAAIARADPFTSMNAAKTAIQAYNNTNNSRNNLDGGVIRLTAGTHTISSAAMSGPVNQGPLMMEASEDATKQTVILQDNGGVSTSTIPHFFVVDGITINRTSSGTVVLFDNGASGGSSERIVAVKNCIFTSNSSMSEPTGSFFYRTGQAVLINCPGVDVGAARKFSTVCSMRNCVGVDYGVNSGTYNALACTSTEGTILDMYADANTPTAYGQFFGFNKLSRSNDMRIVDVDNGAAAQNSITDYGFAMVCNLFEKLTEGSGPCVSVSADYKMGNVRNMVCLNNTTIGQRTNMLYLDGGNSGTTYAQINWAKYGWYKFCVDESFNSKSDVFAYTSNNRIINQDGTQPAELNGYVGNWSQLYKAGFRANTAIMGSDDGNSGGGIGFWYGEVEAWGDSYGSSSSPLSVSFIDDHTESTGDNSGVAYGDYRPASTTNFSLIPVGLAPYPIDMNGATVPNDGTGVAGAFQP